MVQGGTLHPGRVASRRLAKLRGNIFAHCSRADSDQVILSMLLYNFCIANYPAIKLRLPDLSCEPSGPAASLFEGFCILDRLFHTRLAALAEPNALQQLKQESLAQLQDFAAALDLQALCYISEKLLAGDHAKREGVFYTPHPVVSEITRHTFSRVSAERSSPSVLDPACGSGVFLIEAFEILGQDRSCAERERILLHQIFGVDKCPRAVELTKFLLNLSLLRSGQLDLFELEALPDLSCNIKVGNSLLDQSSAGSFDKELGAQLGAFSWETGFPQVMARGGFDCVIGNPPYGLSRDQQLSPEENEVLKKSFQQFRSGKLNKYLAFIARGYQLLREGGELSYIVPNSWLGIEAGGAMRTFLVQEQALSRIVVFDCPVFDEPALEAVIFSASRGRPSAKVEIVRCADLSAMPGKASIFLPAAAIAENEGCKISTIWSSSSAALLAHLDSVSIKMGAEHSCFEPMIALQAYAKGKGVPAQQEDAAKQRVFHATQKLGEDYYPYLEGGDIAPYCLSWSGQYLRYGKFLAEPQSLERFSGARIVIREITRALPYLLSCCLLVDTYLYNKSVLHILLKNPNRDRELWALLAVLNSKLASYVLLQRGRKTQRRIFPKIVNADLRDFPVARFVLEQPSRLAQLAMQLSEGDGRNVELRAVIDREVYAAYQLKNSQVQEIEQVLSVNVLPS